MILSKMYGSGFLWDRILKKVFGLLFYYPNAAGILEGVSAAGITDVGGAEVVNAAGAAESLNQDQTQVPDSGGAASNFGLAGGALDSLGLSASGWLERADASREFTRSSEMWDKQFRENMRRFGLDFALREMAARTGITFAMAQQMWTGATTRENIESENINQQQARLSLSEQYRQRKLAKAFTKGFGQGMSSAKNGGNNANATV